MQTAIQQRNISGDTNINSISVNVANKIQIDNLEKAFAAARPRLVAQAQRRGLTPDVVDDIVQETLVEAPRLSLRHWHFLRSSLSPW